MTNYERQYDDLIRQYGTGVRPGWVSTDLAILRQQIENAKAEKADENQSKENV